MPEWRPRRVLAIGIMFSGAALGWIFLRTATIERGSAPQDDQHSTMLFFRPGIRQPRTEPSATAQVDDDDEVIGVSVNGRHRAYCVSALAKLEQNVVNDLIERVPVTVTYCDRTKFLRAFTQDEESDEPLGVVGRGWYEGKMMIWVAGKTLPQDAETMPGLKNLEVEMTAWKEWKTAHSDTDVYAGSSAHPEGAAE